LLIKEFLDGLLNVRARSNGNFITPPQLLIQHRDGLIIEGVVHQDRYNFPILRKRQHDMLTQKRLGQQPQKAAVDEALVRNDARIIQLTTEGVSHLLFSDNLRIDQNLA
jgi:hypothetical protein